MPTSAIQNLAHHNKKKERRLEKVFKVVAGELKDKPYRYKAAMAATKRAAEK